ncbi:myrosinase 1-like [Planococcus citri]|uniref:myrosinase 1-like n=1 Tax=Planococcus citri TaxID=170843 RepID=UPI0031F98BC2
MSSAFPKDFLFATATSAYQVEGAWNEDGKGENMWDRLIHSKPDKIKNQDTADVACDSYHLYKEDVKLVKDAGFDIYRFSISWTRILPNGEITSINQKGINYYHNLIDELLKNDIQPMVTMYHWDLPQKLQDIGGWVNPLIVDYMEDYADLLFQLYGDKVKWWITINEPFRVGEGYEKDRWAPAINSESSKMYNVMHNTLRAHGRIFRLYDEKYRSKQNGKLSLCVDSHHYEGKTKSKEDIDAANRAYQFQLDIFTHPIYSKEGGYPKIVREMVDEISRREGRKRSKLPTFTEDEIQSLKGANDFFSFNHYSTKLCTTKYLPNSNELLRPTGIFYDDMNVKHSDDPQWPSSKLFWLKVVPYGLREILRYIKNTCNNPPVFIAENGYCDDGELDDKERVFYYREYLKEVLNAMNNYQCDVIGYTAFSLLDNFEWSSGYDPKFGIVHVDFNDEKRKRTPKSSYNFLKRLIKNRTIPADQ